MYAVFTSFDCHGRCNEAKSHEVGGEPWGRGKINAAHRQALEARL